VLQFLTAGYFDETAAERGALSVLTPLDPHVVDLLLARQCDPGTTDAIGGRSVEVRDGCVGAAWHTPGPNPRAVRFVLELQATTGCAIADIEHGRIISPAELHASLPDLAQSDT
jgi:hypothetical protein